MSTLRFFTTAVEGGPDVVVVDRILELAGLQRGPVYVTGGKGMLDKRLRGYNAAAKFSPWLVLRDMDHDADCAPALRNTLLPAPSDLMHFRIAVRAVEAWLLGDHLRISSFLGIAATKIPPAPETLSDPKGAVVQLASLSRRASIRDDLVPIRGSTSHVGPGYTARMIEFASSYWRPEIAARRSPSLLHCIQQLKKYAADC